MLGLGIGIGHAGDEVGDDARPRRLASPRRRAPRAQRPGMSPLAI